MIFIDDRAGSAALVDHAPLDDATVAQLTHLDAGDAMFVGNGPTGSLLIGVEVKRIDELISAQQTGRLTTQVERMLDTYGRNYLAYYGQIETDSEDSLLHAVTDSDEYVYASFGAPIDAPSFCPSVAITSGRKVPFAYLFNLLSDLDESGIHCAHCNTYADVATYIGRLHRAWSKPWAARTYLRTVDNSQPKPLIPRYATTKVEHERIKLFVAAVSHLPGMGYVRALAIAKHFPSMRALFNASVLQLMSVDGIGKTGAKRLHAAMNATRRQ
jgi:ERCC4-type nuclease